MREQLRLGGMLFAGFVVAAIVAGWLMYPFPSSGSISREVMPYDNLLIERDGAVAIVTINRPRVLNAIDAPTLDALRRAILDLKSDEDVRSLILTGAGDRAFVAGADINELAVQTPTTGREHALKRAARLRPD